MKPDDALLAEIKEMGEYRDVRLLPDGSIAAIGDLLFTRALYLGCTRWGWERRFCFDNRTLADQRFLELQSEDDDPKGYIASRPEK